MSYQDGFEDAVELCLTELINSDKKEDAISKIKHILGLIKEDKFERIRKMLGLLHENAPDSDK